MATQNTSTMGQQPRTVNEAQNRKIVWGIAIAVVAAIAIFLATRANRTEVVPVSNTTTTESTMATPATTDTAPATTDAAAGTTGAASTMAPDSATTTSTTSEVSK